MALFYRRCFVCISEGLLVVRAFHLEIMKNRILRPRRLLPYYGRR